jgi:hypothetical protein
MCQLGINWWVYFVTLIMLYVVVVFVGDVENFIARTALMVLAIIVTLAGLRYMLFIKK